MKDDFKPQARLSAHIVRVGLLVATVAALPSVACAQVHDPLRGYNLNGDSVGPAQPQPRGRDVPAVAEGTSSGPAYVSASRIRRVAARQGLKLTSQPHRRGRAYYATAINDAGNQIQLTFNAFNGALIGQKDVDPTIVAKAPSDADTPKPSAPIVAPAADDLAAVRAEAAKAVQAEADARKIAQDLAAETRRTQAKLAEAEAAARKAAQMRATEERRQQAALAETRRVEAKMAEAKRRSLAVAEAKLAQAKAAQERVAVELAKAEALAAQARAAAAPAEMTQVGEKPAEMTKVEQPKTAAESEAAVPAPKPAEAAPKSEAVTAPSTAQTETAKSETAKGEAKSETAKSETAKDETVKNEPMPSKESGSEPKTETATPSETTSGSEADMAPTGSTSQSPPEPYKAPSPDETVGENP